MKFVKRTVLKADHMNWSDRYVVHIFKESNPTKKGA